MFHKKRIGVLYGGDEHQEAVSFKNAHTIIQNLPSESFSVSKIRVDDQGDWFIKGEKKTPQDVIEHLDGVFVTFSGSASVERSLRRLLDLYGTPQVGSGQLSSTMARNKHLAKERFKKHGLKTPNHVLLKKDLSSLEDGVTFAEKNLKYPLVVKPVDQDSSVGVTLVNSPEALMPALEHAYKHSDRVLVEEYIKGKEITVPLMKRFHGEDLKALSPVEIINSEDELLNYDVRHQLDGVRPFKPFSGDFASQRRVKETAKKAFASIDADHYATVDIILGDDGEVYVLEVDTVPEIHEDSIVPHALREYGMSEKEYITHLVDLALTNQL